MIRDREAAAGAAWCAHLHRSCRARPGPMVVSASAISLPDLCTAVERRSRTVRDDSSYDVHSIDRTVNAVVVHADTIHRAVHVGEGRRSRSCLGTTGATVRCRSRDARRSRDPSPETRPCCGSGPAHPVAPGSPGSACEDSPLDDSFESDHGDDADDPSSVYYEGEQIAGQRQVGVHDGKHSLVRPEGDALDELADSHPGGADVGIALHDVPHLEAGQRGGRSPRDPVGFRRARRYGSKDSSLHTLG